MKPFHIFVACALFLFFAIMLTGASGGMLIDTDPLWHIAAGDVIRESGAIPHTDPWSFTAGNYRWLNISWAWDIAMSYAVEYLGWYGAVAINAIIIALIFAIIFISCLAHTGSVIASLIATICVITLMSSMLRPLQITMLMLALWMLILGNVIRRRWSLKTLCILPFTMLLWVNMHGGFLLGPIVIGVFFLQALYFSHSALARALFLTGAATTLATLCNPYGLEIFEAARRPLMEVAHEFILEWQPLTLSPLALFTHFYIVLFIGFVVGRKSSISPAERFLAYVWLLMGLTSVRHLPLFAVISAPVFACALLPYLPKKSGRFSDALLFVYNRSAVAMLALFSCVAAMLWLPSPFAAHFFKREEIVLPTLAPEIAFIEKTTPHVRMLSHFNLGAIIAFETRGALPVFVDPRSETAYPPQLMRDYADFELQKPGWEKIFDRYNLDGVMLPNTGDAGVMRLYAPFTANAGWKMAFKGPTATIFLRENK